MYRFVNDYSEGAHQRILDAMMTANLEQNTGYGLDLHTDKAKEYIKAKIQREDVDIHLIPGGTQTNLLVISSFLRPYEAVIAADTGHINVHETGAIEATGHKVLTRKVKDGKLTAEAILDVVAEHTDEHMVKPKMVYISNSTELGTIYSKEELLAISSVCKEKSLYLFLDGARLGSALMSKNNDLTLDVIASLVDAFYIGGTKNGALLGEALVLCREEWREEFRFLIKQRGAMMAKGFILGIQFEELFRDDLFFELASHANQMADQIAEAFVEAGFEFYSPTGTNQLFPIVTEKEMEQLGENFGFQYQVKLGEDQLVIRLVTSWATTEESVQAICKAIQGLKR